MHASVLPRFSISCNDPVDFFKNKFVCRGVIVDALGVSSAPSGSHVYVLLIARGKSSGVTSELNVNSRVITLTHFKSCAVYCYTNDCFDDAYFYNIY